MIRSVTDGWIHVVMVTNYFMFNQNLSLLTLETFIVKQQQQPRRGPLIRVKTLMLKVLSNVFT